MHRRPLTRIELGLQDIAEFKKFIDLQKAEEPAKAEDTKGGAANGTGDATSNERERRKQAVRHRIGLPTDG
ncbi:hypothetical protein CSKR_200124 [Clonorchis sinensis]|uniref:Anaphase-promoting complex subunit CDC26 n=1 Tax=Clonorchis sinensis TaxID=79923 RepID=A0A8T1LZ55_CLOSI|nr:hypothetical protein CSKR_200124 [Clonorchis sinensis]